MNQFNLSERELATLTPKEILDSHVDVLGLTLGLERTSLDRRRDVGMGWTGGGGGSGGGVGRPPTSTTTTAAGGYIDESTDANPPPTTTTPVVAPARLLRALEVEVESITPREETSAYREARSRCPDLADDVHRTKFLRREDHDPKRAARRLVTYWKARREDFGPAKCYQPLTLRGALRDDLAVLSTGLWSVLPYKDEAGRAIVFFDISRHDGTKYSRDSMLRAGWYIHHVANEDPDVLDKGFVILGTSRNSHLEQFDAEVARRGVALIRDAYPFRLRASHHCHPGPSARVVAPLLPLFGLFFKTRLRMYWGSDDDVLRSLGACNIPRDRVPRQLGGDVAIDNNRWLLDRLAHEEGLFATGGGGLGQTSNVPPPSVGAAAHGFHNTISSDQIQAFGDVRDHQIATPPHTSAIPAHHGQHSQVLNRLGAVHRERLLLYTPGDDSNLSELHCLVRAQIEVFAATQADVDARGPRGGRTCRITVGRVGLRCANCAHLPFHERANASVTFPAAIRNVYQSSRNFKRDHLAACNCIPTHVKEKMTRLGEKRKNSTGVMEYMAESCKRLGLVDSGDGNGIRFM